MSLENSAKIILKDCMALKNNESCLVVTDSKLKPIGNIIYKTALKISKNSKLIFTNIPKTHGAEPPADIAKEMLKYNVVLLATAKSLSHTKSRENASKKGARIASMPSITIDMMKRALNVNFYKIKELNKKLISKLKGKNNIRIITKKGTDAEFYLKGRKWVSDDGIYTKKRTFGNLPAGEIFIAPLEYKTNGVIISDANIDKNRRIENIKIEIKDGFISKIEGGRISNKFKKLLKYKLYKNVAELGIGTNYKAKITGNILEDEKVSGTCHIAFGNNKHFGGKVDVPFHVDGVFQKPTIFTDDKLLMDNGRFVFEIRE